MVLDLIFGISELLPFIKPIINKLYPELIDGIKYDDCAI